MDMQSSGMASMMRPDRTPASVGFGDMYSMGRWMVSYRYMRMDMDGNRVGTSNVSAEDIATTVPNRFFGRPMQPPTLRIVPEDMTGEMHMFGLMYMPSARLNWMFMAPYVEKEMDLVTFRGRAGTARLGEFTTSASGLGDVRAGPLLRLFERDGRHLHLSGMVSFPTGSTDEEDTVLTPLGTTPKVRLPYPMQIGSGTFDLLPGLTYTQRFDNWSFGAQVNANVRLGDNDDDYSFGNEIETRLWASRVWAPWLSTSLQLAFSERGKIDGFDSRIVGPVQTADPDNYGGERLDLGFGINLLGREGALRGHRLRFEYLLPVHQRLNGPQLELDATVVVRYQYMFMR